VAAGAVVAVLVLAVWFVVPVTRRGGRGFPRR
jgi:hypothetical protein